MDAHLDCLLNVGLLSIDAVLQARQVELLLLHVLLILWCPHDIHFLKGCDIHLLISAEIMHRVYDKTGH